MSHVYLLVLQSHLDGGGQFEQAQVVGNGGTRSRIEIQTFQGALKAYARRKDKNLRTLMQYAGMFKVEKILRQYLEVLL